MLSVPLPLRGSPCSAIAHKARTACQLIVPPLSTEPVIACAQRATLQQEWGIFELQVATRHARGARQGLRNMANITLKVQCAALHVHHP